MSAVFLKVLNMSITASWLIIAVVLARVMLKKAPRWLSCLLWGLVAIRLLCPFSFESSLSLIPSSETIPRDIAFRQQLSVDFGIESINKVINPFLAESFTPDPVSSINPLQIVIPVAAVVWIAGVVVMLAYALISYLKLKKTVSVYVQAGERIFTCDEVRAPFILGIFKPIIYVPSSLGGETLVHVIRHEKAHLQRYDHFWKPIGFLLLSVYWFNPLCWLAYILLCRDIETACDEKVISDMSKADLAAYSQALLDCSYPRKKIAACPLAFGETGVKDRVKGVLNYKRPAFWIILAAIIACIALAVCLMTDPLSSRSLSGKLGTSLDMAVAEHHRSSRSEGHFIVADYDVMLISRSGNETTVYVWVLYEEFSFDGIDVKVETGSHVPSAVTFDTSENNNGSSTYGVVEYWEPRDGSYYADDIQAKFPWPIRRRALDISGSRASSEKCLQAAREYYGVINVTGEPDLSFLNYENACSLAADMTDIQTIYCPPAGKQENGSICIGYVDGSELAKYLDLVSWRKRSTSKDDLSSPGSIEFCIREDYRITVYRDSHIAVVRFGNERRFYNTHSGDYEKAVELFYTEPRDSGE